jgi:hypothetical protein
MTAWACRKDFHEEPMVTSVFELVHTLVDQLDGAIERDSGVGSDLFAYF